MGADDSTTPAAGPAGTPGTTPQAGSGQQGAAGGQSEADRLDAVERQLAALAGRAHAGSQQVVQDRLDGPGAIADEVRQQLTARDRERETAAAQQAGESRLATLEQTVKDMAEKAPEPPVRRVERFMGWR